MIHMSKQELVVVDCRLLTNILRVRTDRAKTPNGAWIELQSIHAIRFVQVDHLLCLLSTVDGHEYVGSISIPVPSSATMPLANDNVPFMEFRKLRHLGGAASANNSKDSFLHHRLVVNGPRQLVAALTADGRRITMLDLATDEDEMEEENDDNYDDNYDEEEAEEEEQKST